MRKGILFLLVGAIALAFAPAVMAGVNNNVEYDLEESGHSAYGASLWHANWVSGGNPGDASWGYATGMTPMVAGLMETDFPLLPPLYTDPCPADIIGTFYNMNTSGGCPIHDLTFADTGSASYWQTADLAAETDNVVILDDMLAKMFQADVNPLDTLEEKLNQQLDILFYLDDGVANDQTADFIDQTLDQDLVFFDGNSTSYLSTTNGSVNASAGAGDGIKGRLTTVFDTDGTNTFVDQWVVSFVKDTGSLWETGGIVSSLSSWAKVGTPGTCPACVYTYPIGHDPVDKTVGEINDHP
jgi:hypothetical protein